MYHIEEEKLKRYSLLLKYHNARQTVVVSNKEIVTQDTSTIVESELDSSSTQTRSPEEVAAARKTLDLLSTEEQGTSPAGESSQAPHIMDVATNEEQETNPMNENENDTQLLDLLAAREQGTDPAGEELMGKE